MKMTTVEPLRRYAAPQATQLEALKKLRSAIRHYTQPKEPLRTHPGTDKVVYSITINAWDHQGTTEVVYSTTTTPEV